MMPRNNAFTMIELMVVISIIGILTAIGVVSYVTTQKNARDSRRKADLEELRTALEMYKADHGYYPGYHSGDSNENIGSNNSSVKVYGNDGLTTILKSQGYIQSPIIDPRETGLEDDAPLPCGNPTITRYNYRAFHKSDTFACYNLCDNSLVDKCDMYYLTAIMENTTGKDSSPCLSSTIMTTCCGDTFASDDYCYAKFNP